MNQVGSKAGSLCPQMGQLYDPYAVKWFTDRAENIDKKINAYLENHDKPDDWYDFYIANTNKKLGVSIGIHSIPEDNRIFWRFYIRVDSKVCYYWIGKHGYLLESLLTFRIGPVIIAHPGRKPRYHSKYPMPIQSIETICGFQNRKGIITRVDMDSDIIVEVRKERAVGASEAVWSVKLIN